MKPHTPCMSAAAHTAVHAPAALHAGFNPLAASWQQQLTRPQRSLGKAQHGQGAQRHGQGAHRHGQGAHRHAAAAGASAGLGTGPERGPPACPAGSLLPGAAGAAPGLAAGGPEPGARRGARGAPALTCAEEAAGCRYSLGLTAAVAAMLSLGLREEAEVGSEASSDTAAPRSAQPGPRCPRGSPSITQTPPSLPPAGAGEPSLRCPLPPCLPSAFAGHRRQMVATASGRPRGTRHRAEAPVRLLLSPHGPGLPGSTAALQSPPRGRPPSTQPAPSPCPSFLQLGEPPRAAFWCGPVFSQAGKTSFQLFRCAVGAERRRVVT